ncbi:hypothetical protein KIP88_41355 [Bradyrhizobium sp. SRL28]|uniref:hypothetical protein n=1 Tax=Bradyrhizobium sp. SRL28 TaxID=2836178 RepID=UPI001BDF2EB0|nr:hypothetical protein [Bradyrhizobium sp. SRL28]MBT1516853.1 hypothetical protein [Bradyrhizobium sp. SRL28]
MSDHDGLELVITIVWNAQVGRYSWCASGLWMLVGAVARGTYEARVRELIEHSEPIFVMTI